MVLRRTLNARSARAGSAIGCLLVALGLDGCTDPLTCALDGPPCDTGMSLWLRSEHWPEGRYEVTLDRHRDRSLIRCGFEVAYGDSLAELIAPDAGVEDSSLGTRMGTCMRTDNRALANGEIDLSVGREVEISMRAAPQRLGLRITRGDETVLQQEIVPEYVEYAPKTQCSDGCKHADVELDLGLP